jgi:glutamine synthetase
MSTVCEYLWRDANGNLRSKVRVFPYELGFFSKFPVWNYDGSSTGQTTTERSEVDLFPVKTYNHPVLNNALLILCETSWEGDTRAKARVIFDRDGDLKLKPMFGFEYEFFMYDRLTDKPVGWPENDSPKQQGDYYCGIGANNVRLRKFMNDVLTRSLKIGLNVNGYNFEVAPGQAEFQVCSIGIDACDQLTILKYILNLTGEEYDIYIVDDCKPLGSRWNGSGMHTNFSTKQMRETNDEGLTLTLIEKLGKRHDIAMQIYGKDNNLRLTGQHETSSIHTFSYGVANRAASVRIPTTTWEYFEDRRPNSKADQYEVALHIYESTCLI